MTGTGTQADPYIVDNWADYRQIYTASAYIEWDNSATNKIIDFNEIQPEGFTSQIKFSRYTKFNGWKFRNLFTTAANPLNFGSAGETVDGFILENFYWIAPDSINLALFNFDANYTSISTMKNCVISGKIEAQTDFSFTGANFSESSANIVVNTTGNFNFTSQQIKNSDIILDISAPKVTITEKRILNSRFSGKIIAENPVILGSSDSGYNVFNTETNQNVEYSGKGIMVYNSDKSDFSGTGNFNPCTSEQLKNPAYLNSIRFPIGVD